jgi:DNA-binding transcriptional LysR family regulator
MDLSTRQLRCFVGVADEMNFTRAAASLYLTQPALSRQIRLLEERLGFRLFDRTSRHVELTDGGSRLLAEVRPALAMLDRGISEGRRIELQGGDCLRLGFVIGAALELTPLILEEFRQRRPGVALNLHEDMADPSAGLTGGATDVAVLRPPITAGDVVFETLYVEPRVIVVPLDHPLAEKTEVSFQDVASLPLIGSSIPDDAFADFWVLNDCRNASSPPANVVLAMEENLLAMLERVAAGTACMVSDASSGRAFEIPGIRHIPIVGVPGTAVAVAWRTGRETELVRAFVEAARVVRHRESVLIAALAGGLTSRPGEPALSSATA